MDIQCILADKGVACLKEVRQKRKMSQLELGTKVGVSEETISRYERKIQTPTLIRFCLMADALHVSLDCLIGRINECNPNESALKNMMIYIRLMARSDLKILEEMARLLAMRPEGY